LAPAASSSTMRSEGISSPAAENCPLII
jgi:hypothetical protein